MLSRMHAARARRNSDRIHRRTRRRRVHRCLPCAVFRLEETRKVATACSTAQRSCTPGDEVRLEGRIDGSVTAIEPNPSGPGAKVTMALDSGAGRWLYADAGARLRMKTLLGGSFYVEIDRGAIRHQAPLGSATIPLSRTSVQVEIEDVLTDIFAGAAMQGFKTADVPDRDDAG